MYITPSLPAVDKPKIHKRRGLFRAPENRTRMGFCHDTGWALVNIRTRTVIHTTFITLGSPWTVTFRTAECSDFLRTWETSTPDGPTSIVPGIDFALGYPPEGDGVKRRSSKPVVDIRRGILTHRFLSAFVQHPPANFSESLSRAECGDSDLTIQYNHAAENQPTLPYECGPCEIGEDITVSARFSVQIIPSSIVHPLVSTF